MKNHRQAVKTNIDPIIVLLFGILIIISSLNTSFNEIYKSIGLLTLLTALIVMNVGLLVHLLVKQTIPKAYQSILIFSLIFMLMYLIGILTGSFSARSLIVPFQFMLLINLFIFCSLIKWKLSYIRKIAFVASIYIILSFTWWMVTGIQLPFKAYMGNPNVFGAFTFFLLYFPLLSYIYEQKKIKKTFWLVILFLGLILCFVSMARSIWLSILVGLIVYMLWPIITSTQQKHKRFCLWLIIFAFIGTVLYSKSSTFSKIVEWNQWIYLHTGKTLLSGRDKFWGSLIDAILERPFWGYGGGANLTEIADITLSAHNLYIQIGLQVGIAGLLIFILLLGSIWAIFWKGRNNKTVRLSAAFMAAVIIHQLFEVCLTQNNLTVGLIQWLIMAIGVSVSRNNSDVDIYYKEST